jgi:HEPN domain-containing protein
MDKESLIKYWVEAAELDLPVIDHLYEKGDYVWSLFLSHLVLEKILKAHYAKDNETVPPKIHDLVKLAKCTSLTITASQEEYLDFVNDFNIESRYPKEKFELYKICTKEFCREHIDKIKEMYKWLKSQLT